MTDDIQRQPTVGWLLTSLSGRASRKAYLLAVLLIIVLQLLAFYKIGQTDPEKIESAATGFIFLIIGLAFVWISFALTVKRFHDIGKPGIFALVIFIPVVSLIALVVLCFLPGDPGPNRFGPRTNAPG